MNSMNRTPTPWSRPKRARSTTSSSLIPAHHDRVHLHRRETGIDRRVDTREHALELVALGQREEAITLQCVERHVDAPEPGRREVVRELGQLHAVGRHRDVDTERREQLDEARDVRPHQRLAPGEADRLEAEALDADPSDPGRSPRR